MRVDRVSLGAVWAIVLLLAGCATPAGKQAMSPPDVITTGKQHAAAVRVTASGGSETGALDSSNIANADLRGAIEASISRSKLFREIVQAAGGDYELAVTVIQLSKPTFGLTFTVELEAGWSLLRVSDGRAVWRQIIKTSGTATMSDAFIGSDRLRLALEAAARANIQQGLGAVAGLSL